VEASDHYNPIFLHLEENSERETPHPRPATISVDGRKLQGIFSDRFDRGLNRQRETLP
jgi:hypothetical protein